VNSIVHLQRTIGNQAVQRMLQAYASTDVNVSQPGDASEIEADRVAHTVIRSNGSAAGEADQTIHRKTSSGQSIPSHSPAHVRDVISSGGRPLDVDSRNFFEPRFAQDLSDIRIHTDAKAAQSARALDAKAYALGNNVVFGSGEYRPDSEAGRHLIAHELAHVTQSGSSSNVRGDTIYRQPLAIDRGLAAVEAEIQMLRLMPVLLPQMRLRLQQLEQRRARLLARGAGAPAAPTISCTDKDRALNISQLRNKCLNVLQRWRAYKAHVEDARDYERRFAYAADWRDYVTEEEFERLDTNRSYQAAYNHYLKFYAGGSQVERQQREREQQEERSKPAPAPAEKEVSGDAYLLLSQMRQIDIDLIEEIIDSPFGFGRQAAEPTPSPTPVETGCHPDPYARQTGSTVCGQRRPDEATRATMKAMQMPKPDLEEYYKEQRAMLDRLNAAHLHWQKTGAFPLTVEFSPYEVEKDRMIPVQERWNLYNKPDPDDLDAADFNERFFRSVEEYEAERQRRHNEYLAKKKACGSGRPSEIECRNKVMNHYYPGRYARYDAAVGRQYADMQMAMPVLRQGGPVAGFVFHATHEWLGWSTERAAAAGNFASGLTNLGAAKLQQVFSQRAAGQSVAPPADISPPATHVAPPPARDPVTPPSKPSVSPTGPAADPWAGIISRPVDITGLKAFPPEPEPPSTIVTPPPVKTPVDPKDFPMRRPPGGGDRGPMTGTEKTVTAHKGSTPVVEYARPGTVAMGVYDDPPAPGHYIRRKPPDAQTAPLILEQAGRTTDGLLRDANTGRGLKEGEAVFGHAPEYQFAPTRDRFEKEGRTQAEFDEFFRDPAKWQIEYGRTNSSRVFDRIPRQRPVH
jgi:hypothetical protein